jgi:hypothetical protein
MVLQGHERAGGGNRHRDVEFREMQAQARKDEEEAAGNLKVAVAAWRRQCRVAEQHRAWETTKFALSGVDVDGRGLVNGRLVGEVVQRLDYFLNAQLHPIEERRCRDAIMERYLSSATVRPHMPEYYLKPSDARV